MQFDHRICLSVFFRLANQHLIALVEPLDDLPVAVVFETCCDPSTLDRRAISSHNELTASVAVNRTDGQRKNIPVLFLVHRDSCRHLWSQNIAARRIETDDGDIVHNVVANLGLWVDCRDPARKLVVSIGVDVNAAFCPTRILPMSVSST